MVFTRLPAHEKDAFFALLDEYFASRPHLLGDADPAAHEGPSDVRVQAASAVYKAAAAHPEQASRLLSAGLRHANSSSSAGASDAHTGDDATKGGSGRVANAAMSFASNAANRFGGAAKGAAPSPPARGGASSSEQPHGALASAKSLVAVKRFGDVDTSSAKNMFSSIRGGTANKSAVPVPVAPPPPSAFGAPKADKWGPPPSRRLSSNTSAADDAPAAPSPPAPAYHEEPAQGEWAEALYDYSTAEAGDLQIQAGQQILVTERTSDDWWTGEMDGRTGLFPASYVKLL